MTVVLTHHARTRARQMGVEEEAVITAVLDPSYTYPGPARYGEHRIAAREELACPYKLNGDDVVVLTVLWNGRVSKRPAC